MLIATRFETFFFSCTHSSEDGNREERQHDDFNPGEQRIDAVTKVSIVAIAYRVATFLALTIVPTRSATP